MWLCQYTFWYQSKPFSTSANADILVMLVVGVLSLAFILIPFLPATNRIPRWIPIYKLISHDHYRAIASGRASPSRTRQGLRLGFFERPRETGGAIATDGCRLGAEKH